LVKYKGYELERVRLNDKKLLFISVNSWMMKGTLLMK
jgi:hypothetical protein